KSNRKHSLSDTPKRTGEIECETAKKTKTTQDPSTLASSTSCDDETEEQDEQIEIDLVDLKKQLEMEPLIEWKVGNINVTRKFRQYQRSVIDKVISYGLKWSDSYEILAFASIIVLSWPCPYSKFFTNREWDQVTRTNPYVIRHPVIPSSISTVLREVAMMHLMGKESHMQSDESKLSKAVARTFNDLCDIPTHSPTKISEELHCDMLLYPYINSLFFGRLAEYEVRLNRTIKPLGVTLLGKKKDFAKVHLRAKKSVNQQLNLKGGPGEAGSLINMGDEVESFFMNFKYGLYCSWPFHRTRLATDKASMPLIESNFCHFVALEERVNKLAEDFKGRNQPFTPPLQMKFMTEFPDSPQLKQLLELS
ncbi:1383_t:CDS:2, partial [Cetraspora pellucida]